MYEMRIHGLGLGGIHEKWVIARPINGISINGDEYAVNVDGKYVCFDSEEEATDRMERWYEEAEIEEEGIYVKEIEVED